MKLTTKILKQIIKEEIENINEYEAMSPGSVGGNRAAQSALTNKDRPEDVVRMFKGTIPNDVIKQLLKAKFPNMSDEDMDKTLQG